MNCATCGDPFTPRHGKHRFCSDKCQGKAKYRARNPLASVRFNPLDSETFYETPAERDERREALRVRLAGMRE